MAQDFERTWQNKLACGLEQYVPGTVKADILSGGIQLSDQAPRSEVIAWTQNAVSKLEHSVPEQAVRQVLSGCACLYPHEALQPLRETYLQSGDIAEVHSRLLAMFRTFLANTLNLTGAEIEIVLSKGWGLAGILQGDRILATKIPKSGYLKAYLHEKDPERRREMYCHCPRVRDAVKLNSSLPISYCYCGAGFYQDLWETILDEPVRVEVKSSVLQGDDVCSILIFLPGHSVEGPSS